ncbi:hypothetical protein Taro_003501 [Colocasia esculenta]|uniref:Uncharacterized protein n=1 Tax=Colocasia esculenta TaxID=4460 RepID=A0A843TJI9_COLES|nr:hypothetical protein [Colocasia esculenta]
MDIAFRSVIRIAYKTPIRNRHSKLTISPFSRFSSSNIFLDHTNHLWGHNSESANYDDWKLFTSQRENSSQGRTMAA